MLGDIFIIAVGIFFTREFVEICIRDTKQYGWNFKDLFPAIIGTLSAVSLIIIGVYLLWIGK